MDVTQLLVCTVFTLQCPQNERILFLGGLTQISTRDVKEGPLFGCIFVSSPPPRKHIRAEHMPSARSQSESRSLSIEKLNTKAFLCEQRTHTTLPWSCYFDASQKQIKCNLSAW